MRRNKVITAGISTTAAITAGISVTITIGSLKNLPSVHYGQDIVVSSLHITLFISHNSPMLRYHNCIYYYEGKLRTREAK